MAEITHLDNAPIKEAIIDIQVELAEPPEVVLEKLNQLAAELEDTYPVKQDINHGNFGIHINDEQTLSTDIQHSRIGVKLNSQDDLQIVQLKISGFTFSRLEPYESWDQMEQEAKRLWDIYSNALTPINITRVATRFINVMRIPMNGSVDFDKVLTAAPQVPENLPQGIVNFLTRVIIPYIDYNAAAIVTQAFEALDNNHVPITLDIDVFSKQSDSEETDLWELLGNLREIKNKIFFESIQDETAELFK